MMMVIMVACHSGWVADRSSRWGAADAVSQRSCGDVETDPGASWRWTVQAASVSHPHHPPWPGHHDTETETTRQRLISARLTRVWFRSSISIRAEI